MPLSYSSKLGFSYFSTVFSLSWNRFRPIGGYCGGTLRGSDSLSSRNFRKINLFGLPTPKFLLSRFDCMPCQWHGRNPHHQLIRRIAWVFWKYGEVCQVRYFVFIFQAIKARAPHWTQRARLPRQPRLVELWGKSGCSSGRANWMCAVRCSPTCKFSSKSQLRRFPTSSPSLASMPDFRQLALK